MLPSNMPYQITPVLAPVVTLGALEPPLDSTVLIPYVPEQIVPSRILLRVLVTVKGRLLVVCSKMPPQIPHARC